ncbi:MAG TPA: oligosaccharide flippase family protein, partial [Sphingobacterium sp.]|nr:oligosaccharide flippase family protein [Sphingobacterium sp.]
EVNDKDYSSMFVFNLAVSTVLYLALFISAPFIETYYGISGLALYARVLFLQLLIHAFGIVQYVKVLKNMQFNITARVNVLAVFLSGTIAIAMTFLDFGPWVLIWQPVLYSTFRTTLFWLWGNWKIDFSVSKTVLKRHLGFSLSFMAANMLGKVLSPLYVSFVGKHYSEVQTGHYYQANKWGETPNLLISSIIQGTTLSTLTSLQDDRPRFLNACRKSMSTLVFVLLPVSFLAISVAEPAFVLVLTEKYRHAVSFFQLLCLAGIFISLTDMNVNFVNIKGRSRYALILEIVKVSLALLLLGLTYDKGVLTIIYGQLAVRIVSYVLSTQFSRLVYGYSLGLQFRDLLSATLISGSAAFLSFLPQYFSVLDNLLGLLILQSVIFIVVYCGLNHLTRNTIWMELLQLVKNKILKQNI